MIDEASMTPTNAILRHQIREQAAEIERKDKRIAELNSALAKASAHTWIGEFGQPGSCFWCGEHRLLHREGGMLQSQCAVLQPQEGEK